MMPVGASRGVISPERLRGVMALDGEEDEGQIAAEISGRHRPHARGRGLAVALDGEPLSIDGLDVRQVAVHEQHVVSGAREGGAGGAPIAPAP